MLLSEAIERYMRYMIERRDATETTDITYRSILRKLKRYMGDVDISKLTLQTIDEYAIYLADCGLAQKTRHTNISTIRSFMRYLYGRGFTDVRPEGIDVPRPGNREANFLTAEEQELLYKQLKYESVRTRAIVRTIVASGLRVSELINLHYDDIYKRSVIVRSGKGRKPRITFITQAARTAINNYLKTKPRTEYLFTNKDGDKLSRQYITQIITACAERAGIVKHVSPHTLCHTFATNLLMNGARAEVVQPMMGHENIRSTLIYMHFTNPYLQREYEKYAP